MMMLEKKQEKWKKSDNVQARENRRGVACSDDLLSEDRQGSWVACGVS